MAVALRAVTTAGGGSGGNLTVTKPTGTVDNDIVLIGGYEEISGSAFTLPSGFAWHTTAIEISNGGGWNRVAWKRASSEGASWTFNISTTWRTIIAASFSGCITSGDPFDSTAASRNGLNTTAAVSSITNASANSMNVGFVCTYNEDNLGIASSGYTDGGFLSTLNLFYGLQAASGASGIKTFTATSASGNWASWHVSLKEATAVVIKPKNRFSSQAVPRANL